MIHSAYASLDVVGDIAANSQTAIDINLQSAELKLESGELVFDRNVEIQL